MGEIAALKATRGYNPNKGIMPPPVPIGDTPLERAYRWYSRLNGPPHAEMMATVNKTPDMDITADDVDLLPWIPLKPNEMACEIYPPHPNSIMTMAMTTTRAAAVVAVIHSDDDDESTSRRRRQARDEAAARQQRLAARRQAKRALMKKKRRRVKPNKWPPAKQAGPNAPLQGITSLSLLPYPSLCLCLVPRRI